MSASRAKIGLQNTYNRYNVGICFYNINYTTFDKSYVTVKVITISIFELYTKYMKSNIISKPVKPDGMLYQKTNEDFNREKPSKEDPLLTEENPIQQEEEQKNLPFTKKVKK